MLDIEKIFFELIRVALGNAFCLSNTPTAEEWQMLYEMAKKQSLVGISFAGVQRLQGQMQCPLEQLYLQWMGMAAKIQQRNDVVNRQCVEVQKMLAVSGFNSSILKGQGIASLYNANLNGNHNVILNNCSDKDCELGSRPGLGLLRQSGDIDVWVEGGLEKVLSWCREKYGNVEFDYINAHVPIYNDTDVELHWRVQALTNLVANRKLQRRLDEHQEDMFNAIVNLNANDTITTPSAEFNAFYILLHCYHHMFESGLGLRQLMDYYFVLCNLNLNANPNVNFDYKKLFKEFGMEKFARGVMWIIKTVFVGHVNDDVNDGFYLGIKPDEQEGRFLLKEVMQNGNFGHHDDRKKKVGSGKLSELWRNVHHNWHLASHYPMEMVWQPVWLGCHYFWKRNFKLKTR